jgi:hypothetical protein
VRRHGDPDSDRDETEEHTMTQTTLDITSATTTVDTYLSMWNEGDAARRAEIIAAAWAPDGRYVDPLLEASGHDELSGIVAAVHGQYPGQRFTRTSSVDLHHDQVRFGWQLAAADGTVTVAGLDVGQLGADGRLQRITGFFGGLPDDGAA